jgi:photosystem II stability/assembly factor-like uncharacterized protein
MCQPWNSFPYLVVSPAFSEDGTLLSKGFDYDLEQAFVVKSTSRGISWTTPFLMDHGAIVEVAFSPNYFYDQTAYLSDISGSLARSIDGGQTWITSSYSFTQGVPSLAVVASNTLFVGVGGGPPYMEPRQGLFYSENGGQTWEQLYQGGVDDVAVSPNYIQDHTVLIGVGGYHWNGGILKSTDSGHTWQPSYEGLPWGQDGDTVDITFSPGYAQDHTIFTISWGGLYKSADDGTHWTRISSSPQGTPWGSVTQFVLSPRYVQDRTLWLSGYAEGNLISTDGGNIWRSMPEAVVPIAAGSYCPPESLCRIELFGYAWDQNYNNYAYKSFDGGMTWQCLETDYTPLPIVPRAFLPMVSKP